MRVASGTEMHAALAVERTPSFRSGAVAILYTGFTSASTTKASAAPGAGADHPDDQEDGGSPGKSTASGAPCPRSSVRSLIFGFEEPER
jgi:hypothetical protein